MNAEAHIHRPAAHAVTLDALTRLAPGTELWAADLDTLRPITVASGTDTRTVDGPEPDVSAGVRAALVPDAFDPFGAACRLGREATFSWPLAALLSWAAERGLGELTAALESRA